jgi:hypothetical protein
MRNAPSRVLPLPLTFAFSFACASTFALAPADAQVMGSTNRDAPTVRQSIEFKDGSKIALQYVAITTAGGQTLEKILDKDGGVRHRERFNSAAKRSAIGQLELGKAMTIGNQALPAGSYEMRFNIGEDLKWELNLNAVGDDSKTWTLALETAKAKTEMPRLRIAALPGKKTGTATLSIAYAHLQSDFDMAGSAATDASGEKTKGRDADNGKR